MIYKQIKAYPQICKLHDFRVYRLAVESISLSSVEHHRCSVTCLTNYTCSRTVKYHITHLLLYKNKINSKSFLYY